MLARTLDQFSLGARPPKIVEALHKPLVYYVVLNASEDYVGSEQGVGEAIAAIPIISIRLKDITLIEVGEFL